MSVNALQPSRDPVVENVVLDGLSEHVCRYDRDGTLTYVNDAFATHYGLSPSELIGHSVFDFMAAAERVEAKAPCRIVVTGRARVRSTSKRAVPPPATLPGGR